MSKLTVINIINNKLIDLPPNIDKLKGLEVLDMKQNPAINWTSAFLQLSKLENLKNIDISNNNIEALPNEITAFRLVAVH